MLKQSKLTRWLKTGAIVVGVGLLGLITIWLWDDVKGFLWPALLLAIAVGGHMGSDARKWGDRNW